MRPPGSYGREIGEYAVEMTGPTGIVLNLRTWRAMGFQTMILMKGGHILFGE